jgi:hypothetical protein
MKCDGSLLLLPRFLALGEGVVVDATTSLQLICKLPFLDGIRFQTVFESAPHKEAPAPFHFSFHPLYRSLSRAAKSAAKKRKSEKKIGVSVRRAKMSIFSGCNSHPATFVPAGSNRNGSGGNDTAEASDGKGRSSGPASRQAVT